MTTLLARLRDRAECMRVKPLLQSYLDGELTEQQAVRVSRHVDACRRCGLAAETLRDIKGAVSRLGQPPDRAAIARLRAFVDELGDDTEP